MGLSINTNAGAILSTVAAKRASKMMDEAMIRLSTGKRINTAKDDPGALAVATRMAAEINGLATALRNANDAQAAVDTGEGALKEVHTLLLRMRELAVQAQNGTMQTSDVTALGVEFDALEAEIDRISTSTTWGGKAIIDGSFSTGTEFNIEVGGAADITHLIKNMAATSLGLVAGNTVGANSTISKVDAAIASLSEERAKLGAVSNRLDSTVANLDQIAVNLSASQGRIEDADFAQETANLAKGQILQQAATAMVAQANASKSTVLTLLRG